MAGLIGLSPEEIEQANTSLEDKLLAYRTVYKAFWEAKQDSRRIAEEATKDRNILVRALQNDIDILNWEKTCI